MSNLVFITGNQNKANFLQQYFGRPIDHHKLDLDEIQSLDLQTVAAHKAEQAFAMLKRPVLVEDASLAFTAMGRLPGTFIKWFIEDMGIPGLGKLAMSLDSQAALATIVYAYHDGTRVHVFDGYMKGHIVAEPRGENGFGFDAIFVNEGYSQTRGEMSESDYAATSYRTMAMSKLKNYLENN